MERCPECGAEWVGSWKCVDDFHQMLAWESEDQALWDVHHLMVLCYHLQHPSLYSPQGLIYSMNLLVQFVEQGESTEEVRRSSRDEVDSGKRKWKIKGKPGSQGSYGSQLTWTMRGADVVAGGKDNYRENVRAWASSVLDTLYDSGNLPPTNT